MARRGPLGPARCPRVTTLAAACLATLTAAGFAPSADAACSAPTASGRSFMVTCPAIGSEQSFVVPSAVTSVRVTAVGAGGGAGGRAQYLLSGAPGSPGVGAIAVATLRVNPRSILYVLAGGVGGTSDFGLPGSGGFNGGGSGGGRGTTGMPSPNEASSGGGGGGASDVRTCSMRAGSCDTLASRLIVAAGGGGGGGAAEQNDFSRAGDGGSAGTDGNGQDGHPPSFSTVAGGKGATHSAGGAGGDATAGAGRRGVGGRGANGRDGLAAAGDGPGGGGGGGLFGGGGGASPDDPRVQYNYQDGGAGGGGGSSFGPSGTAFASAPARSPGVVTISYAVKSAGAPSVIVTRPRAGQVLRRLTGRTTVRQRDRLVISGRAGDASGVRGVTLKLERLPRTGKRCTWLDAARGLRRGDCARPPTLIARMRTTASWAYRVDRRISLTPGRYRVTAYGEDRTGAFGNSAPRRERVITFALSPR
jgi:hypothetical protein